MQQANITVLVISISNPILIGIYKDDLLIDTISKEGKTSDVLPVLFDDILSQYNIRKIIYANGPGSYMAIKVAYIFLKTISIVHRIEFVAVSGFELNNNSPIKALGKKYFFRNTIEGEENISISLLEDKTIEEFSLPSTLNSVKMNEETLPQYNLPAV